MLTEGLCLETKEAIGGFWIIDAPGKYVTFELAAAESKACQGTIEVRPI